MHELVQQKKTTTLRPLFMAHRSTKNFIIEASYDQVNWNPVISDSLEQPSDSCNMRIEEFAGVTHARYIRYTSVDYYGGNGGGLNFMSWLFVS